MLSLATVSFSACSLAISSRTGATILHGPHHSAQKSTSTGLSLPSTSLAKVASVTVTVLPAMEVLPLDRLAQNEPDWRTSRAVDLCPRRRPRAGSRCELASSGAHGVLLLAFVEGLGEPALGVDRCGRTGAGRGDRLPVDVVDHVSAGEDAVDGGAGRRVIDLDVAGVVELQLPREELATGIVADRHEQSGDRNGLGGAGGDVGEL